MHTRRNLSARALVFTLSALVAASVSMATSSAAENESAGIGSIPIEQPNGARPAASSVIPIETISGSVASGSETVVSSATTVSSSANVVTIPQERPDVTARHSAKKQAPRRVSKPRRAGSWKLRLGFAWPVTKAAITSPFGWRPYVVLAGQTGPHPTREFHHGADISCALNQPVVAAKGGRVILSGVNPDYGNVVVIAHAGGWSTLYGHLNKRLVVAGRRVPAHGLIGLCGKTGRATGVHMHLEIRHLGQFFDPIPFLP
ncbi:MAG: M23 family metallopeptidase [Actinomycetota bacterium]